MKKVILIETSFLSKKDKRHQKKKLNCTFIIINTSRENCDADYEGSEIQAFISQFKDNKMKERDNKNKELKDENKKLKDEIEKLKPQLENLGVKNNNVNDKK